MLDACEALPLFKGSKGSNRSPVSCAVSSSGPAQVISEVDAPFDPNLHEAAMSEPGDDDQDGPVVAQILRTGYAWNGRVLRAAMVKVRG